MRIICYLISALLLSSLGNPLSAKDMLSSTTTVESLKPQLVLDHSWVPFPDYADREGWDKLLGTNKEAIIKRGEGKLRYKWKYLKATDFLAYERTGDRNIMQTPNSDNVNALSDLVVAELAERKGRFIDQIINGVFYQCERSSLVLSAH